MRPADCDWFLGHDSEVVLRKSGLRRSSLLSSPLHTEKGGLGLQHSGVCVSLCFFAQGVPQQTFEDLGQFYSSLILPEHKVCS